MPRPDPLPPSARRVLNASRRLDPTAKVILSEMAMLDRSGDGCFIRPSTLASRCGITRPTLERWRPYLLAQGLLARQPRAGYCDSWFVTLPPDCIPPRRPTEGEVLALAARLDAHLANGNATQPTVTSGGRFEGNLPPATRVGSAKPTHTGGDGPPKPTHTGGINLPTPVRGPISVLSSTEKTSVLKQQQDGGALAPSGRTENGNDASQEAEEEPDPGAPRVRFRSAKDAAAWAREAT